MKQKEKLIKEINGKNIKEALDLVNLIFEEFVARDYSQEGKKTFADYLKIKFDEVSAEVVSGQKKIWGYYENDKIIGVIAVKQISHIALFFVDKKHQKKGIGHKLFNCALKFVKENKEKKITVNSSLYAVPIYESLGFEKTNGEKESNGIIYVPMEKTKI